MEPALPGIENILINALEFITPVVLPGWDNKFTLCEPERALKAGHDFMVVCESSYADFVSRVDVMVTLNRFLVELKPSPASRDKVKDAISEFANQCCGAINNQWKQVGVYPQSTGPRTASVADFLATISRNPFPSVCAASGGDLMHIRFGCIFGASNAPDIRHVKFRVETEDIEFF